MQAPTRLLPRHGRLWLLFGLAVSGAFFILGFFGREVYRQAPPIPSEVRTTDGRLLMTRDDILTGQTVWQSTGGQQLGSIWGHGAYQAPDWTADWLHREATSLLDEWSLSAYGAPYAQLDEERRAGLQARLKRELRTNTFDEASGVVVISNDRARAIARVAQHYDDLFGGAPALRQLRDDYAMQDVVVPDAARRVALTQFFFWTSWASATTRPGHTITYTNNWPHEPLIDNVPSSGNVLWSIVSVVLLLTGIGALVWLMAFRPDHADAEAPVSDPFARFTITPSMRAVGKYVAVVVALFIVQVLLGALTAHYTVEGQHFYGFPLANFLPYSLTRTWHIQTAMFWIATAFLAAGLFIAPAIGGREPRFQRLGVNLLFGALLVVVTGSLAGEYLAIHQKLALEWSFWFGHQGYEYVELGRVWQIALFAGLAIWLTLMLRALWPALSQRTETRSPAGSTGSIADKRAKLCPGQDGVPREAGPEDAETSEAARESASLVWMFTFASAAVGLMYGAGFFITAKTHLTVMEYWRWWVVHLWVEGFFEVFATAALALIFARMGLVKPGHAGAAVIGSSALFLFAGIPGTFHHLYFSGTPTSIMAVGATFSALEVIPLVLIGFEAFQTYRLQHAASWMRRYRWPVTFFVGVAFWNLVGAGLFGFLINPPIALYYMQGLNTTPVHAHTALFGVYGLLSLGLMLVVARLLTPGRVWKEKWLGRSFWAMNVGLGLMVGLSLLPIGLMQTYASIETGLWFARSAEFLQQPLIENLRWLRLVGDTIFLIGVAAFAWFMAGLWFGWSYGTESTEDEGLVALPSRRPA